MIGVRELRADLAAHVRRASAGERVVVAVGGRPAAQLGPLEPEAGAATLADLVSTGQLVAPRRTDEARPLPPVPIHGGGRLDRVLREIRG